VDRTIIAEPTLTSGQWQELSIDIPRTVTPVTPATHAVEIDATDAEFDSLHYWSYQAD
jgi:hypothetical protein